VNDQLLTNVSVGFVMDPDDVWEVHSIVPLKELAYGKTGSCYVALKHSTPGQFPTIQVASEVSSEVMQVSDSRRVN
jgi:coatomer subunit gamma